MAGELIPEFWVWQGQGSSSLNPVNGEEGREADPCIPCLGRGGENSSLHSAAREGGRDPCILPERSSAWQGASHGIRARLFLPDEFWNCLRCIRKAPGDRVPGVGSLSRHGKSVPGDGRTVPTAGVQRQQGCSWTKGFMDSFSCLKFPGRILSPLKPDPPPSGVKHHGLV